MFSEVGPTKAFKMFLKGQKDEFSQAIKELDNGWEQTDIEISHNKFTFSSMDDKNIAMEAVETALECVGYDASKHEMSFIIDAQDTI